MNCECVFVLKEAKKRNDIKYYDALANIINNLEIDLEPWYISKITKPTKAYNYHEEAMWPGQQKRKVTTLNENDLVLFVGGKYHYMFKTELYKYIGSGQKWFIKDFLIVFPDLKQDDFFEDITEIR